MPYFHPLVEETAAEMLSFGGRKDGPEQHNRQLSMHRSLQYHGCTLAYLGEEELREQIQ